jgi:signal transduction histidine kinase
MGKRCGIQLELKTDDVIISFDDANAALVFRAVRELLMNVFKHANSPSAVVSLQREADAIRIDVEDRGVGFDVAEVGSRVQGSGFGLFSVREQIGRLGGSLEITSVPQQGTRVSLRVPALNPENDHPSSAAAPSQSK